MFQLFLALATLAGAHAASPPALTCDLLLSAPAAHRLLARDFARAVVPNHDDILAYVPVTSEEFVTFVREGHLEFKPGGRFAFPLDTHPLFAPFAIMQQEVQVDPLPPEVAFEIAAEQAWIETVSRVMHERAAAAGDTLDVAPEHLGGFLNHLYEAMDPRAPEWSHEVLVEAARQLVGPRRISAPEALRKLVGRAGVTDMFKGWPPPTGYVLAMRRDALASMRFSLSEPARIARVSFRDLRSIRAVDWTDQDALERLSVNKLN